MGDKEDRLGSGELGAIQELFSKEEGTTDNKQSLNPVINKTKARFEKITKRLNNIEEEVSDIDGKLEKINDSKILIHEGALYIKDSRTLKWYSLGDITLTESQPPISALSSKDKIDETKKVPDGGMLKSLLNK